MHGRARARWTPGSRRRGTLRWIDPRSAGAAGRREGLGCEGLDVGEGARTCTADTGRVRPGLATRRRPELIETEPVYDTAVTPDVDPHRRTAPELHGRLIRAHLEHLDRVAGEPLYVAAKSFE